MAAAGNGCWRSAVALSKFPQTQCSGWTRRCRKWQRLGKLVRAGVPKRQLAQRYGVSLRSVYRLLV
ncbi:helix-turn-helix domain-containing protein [Glycomyces tarimensis]